MPRPIKGHRTPGSGRAKGQPNHTTRAVREALVEAFEKLGGVDYLVTLGRDDPPTFARLLGRLVPNEISAKVEQTTRLRLIDLSDARSDAMTPGDFEPVDAGPDPLDLRAAPRELPTPEAPPLPVSAPDPIPAAPAPDAPARTPWTIQRPNQGGIQDVAEF